MEERNIRFRHDYVPILYQQGHLDVTPEDSFNVGKLFNSLTTHPLILPKPNEIRTVRLAHADDKMTERMPWMSRQLHLQGRVDHTLYKCLRDRGTGCNHGHLVMPDYIVPGYTGCLYRNPSYTATLFKRCCPMSNYDYDVIQNTKPYDCQHVTDPCKQFTPIVPGLRLCSGRREWL
ncbi:uncharacterized protein TNIN_260241 [Trichonephila inaurata madagascariensis]|uniref:Uncharacterized protein n=1 Tax=Trichonephila inaurata madagascariensis TaxID=2747483 RepID=A0A8X6MHS4_9ARAC|nr:uncharacterized protein TNIN_260241 [Trichonephila inaurata madagascariensis]